MLGRKRGEGDVIAALDSVCDHRTFAPTTSFRPKWCLAVSALLEFDEHIERLFISQAAH
jgi:hypothetical protein